MFLLVNLVIIPQEPRQRILQQITFSPESNVDLSHESMLYLG